jgi:thioredoxin-related protein
MTIYTKLFTPSFAMFLGKNYLFDRHQQTTVKNQRPSSLVGKKLTLANADWSSHKQSVLIVLQQGCRFCEESMPFYQRLTKVLSNEAKTHLVALLPQNEQEGRKYLKEQLVEITDVRQISLNSIGVQGTPTLFLVDSEGSVLEQWTGKIPQPQEDAIITRLKQ